MLIPNKFSTKGNGTLMQFSWTFFMGKEERVGGSKLFSLSCMKSSKWIKSSMEFWNNLSFFITCLMSHVSWTRKDGEMFLHGRKQNESKPFFKFLSSWEINWIYVRNDENLFIASIFRFESIEKLENLTLSTKLLQEQIDLEQVN